MKKFKKEEAYFAAVRSDLKVFLRHSFGYIFPTSPFMDNWHLDAIVYALMQAVVGNTPRLIVNLPPRYLKSFIASVVLPAFLLGRDPSAKIICVSYSDDLAKTLSLSFRRIVESSWYRSIFPNVQFIKSTEGEMVTDQGGGRYATSVGGTLTGRGGDIIILDDPIKPEDARSDKTRDSVNEWFRNTLLSRLDDKARSILIIVMQRIHVNDLTGFVEAGGGFTKLSFAAIATKDEIINTGEGETYERLEGEALHPERESVKTLEMIRDQMGSFNFASQYQQRPETPEGSLFKRKWLKFISAPPAFRADGMFTVSIDSALSTSETADYSAISVIYSDASGHYVLEARRGRWDYETLKAIALRYSEKNGRNLNFIVEAAGNGFSLINALRRAAMRCFDYPPDKDKMTRACYAVPIVECGRVFIVNVEGRNGWVEPYVNELVSFPHGRFDDQVDSLVQYLPWAERRLGHGGDYFGRAA